jgi:hypothetical protein
VAAISFFSLSAAFGQVAMAQQTVEVALKDGSTIRGRLLETRDHKLWIHTESMGPLSIDLENVARMVTPSGTASQRLSEPTSASAITGRAEQQTSMDVVKSSLMSNPDVLAAMMTLVDDPEVLHLALDPDLQAAIASGNLTAASQNPNLQELLNHPKIRAIMDRLSK